LFSRVARAATVYSRKSFTVVVDGSAGPPFVRGDVNADGEVDLSDAVRVLRHLFLGQPPSLECEKSADADGGGKVDLADIVHLLSYLFLSGPPPRAPHPACGAEREPTALTCGSFPRCG